MTTATPSSILTSLLLTSTSIYHLPTLSSLKSHLSPSQLASTTDKTLKSYLRAIHDDRNRVRERVEKKIRKYERESRKRRVEGKGKEGGGRTLDRTLERLDEVEAKLKRQLEEFDEDVDQIKAELNESTKRIGELSLPVHPLPHPLKRNLETTLDTIEREAKRLQTS